MMKPNESILEVRNLATGYKKHVVMANLNYSVESPALISLIGPNGAGKSTLLKTLSGEIRPISGCVYIGERSLSAYSRKDISRIIAIVSTEVESSTGGLTVRELVGLGRQPYTGFLGIMSQSDNDIVDFAMQRVNIAHKASCFIGNLSDGERQKAMIARALAQDTPIIFLDEPFSFLDPAARIEIFMLLKREVKDNNKLVVLSTHDVAQALRLSDRLWLINERSLMEMNPREAVQSGVIASIYNTSSVDFSSEIGDFIPKISN